MKKLVGLMCEHLKVKIQTKRILKNNLYKQDELLCTLAQAIVELREVVDEVKETNFKDLYYEEHLMKKDLEKEIKKLRKEVKGYEKGISTKNS